MVLEHAILYIVPGKETAFEKDFKTASQYISSVKGYIRHSLRKCLEQESKYLLLIEWETLEDHTVGFRQSEPYKHWRSLLHEYYDPFPVVEHYKTILEIEKP
jgi:heme-degrading monooxygenase HmoA